MLLERFEQKVGRGDGCWLWTGETQGNGYGRFAVSIDGDRVRLLAHRVAYVEAHGPVPDGLDVGHTCHDQDESCPGGKACIHRLCCNPDHLAAMTRAANLQASGRTGRKRGGPRVAHCVHGHPYDEENTWTHPTSGQRACKTCNRLRHRKPKDTADGA